AAGNTGGRVPPPRFARTERTSRDGIPQRIGRKGYIEGRNVAIEYRWAHDHNDRLPELAADLVRMRVAVIATPGSTAAAAAAKSATDTIPIVFSGGGDPVETCLMASLNRPGGNVTGVSSMSGELGPKRLGIIQELVPSAARFAMLDHRFRESCHKRGIHLSFQAPICAGALRTKD